MEKSCRLMQTSDLRSIPIADSVSHLSGSRWRRACCQGVFLGRHSERGSQSIPSPQPYGVDESYQLPPSPLSREQVLAPPVTFKFFHSVGGFFLGPSQGDVRPPVHPPSQKPVASQTAPPLRPATRLGQRITKWVADDGSSPRSIRAFLVLFLFLIQLVTSTIPTSDLCPSRTPLFPLAHRPRWSPRKLPCMPR